MLSFEIDDNILQLALYKMRNVNGGTKVILVDRNISDQIPMATMLGDNLDYLGIQLEIEGVKVFFPYDYIKDISNLQFGDKIAEHFVKKIVNKS